MGSDSELIHDLRARASKLERAAVKLREAIAVLEESFGAANGSVAPKLTRFGQIRKLLLENGPLSRSEIIERSGVPKGTISALLTAEHFARTESGEWTVKQEDNEAN